MPKKPTRAAVIKDDEIEDSDKISQAQLNNAKLYSSREEYAKSVPQGIRFLEFGVAWGYSADMFITASNG